MKISQSFQSLQIDRYKIHLKQKAKQFIADFLFQWVLHIRSQPLTVTTKSVMVFSPHQDDETLGCGGLIAMKRSQQIPVQIMFLTDGRYGRPDWIAPEEIVHVRQQEALSALDCLGVARSNVQFLNYIDGSLNSLSEADRHQLINQIAALLQTHQPEEVYVPHSQDRHPDHEITFELVQAAIIQAQLNCVLFEYPIWLFWKNPRSLLSPSKISAYRLAIAPEKAQKHRAIAAYQSQLPGLTSAFVSRFFSPYEVFFSTEKSSS